MILQFTRLIPCGQHKTATLRRQPYQYAGQTSHAPGAAKRTSVPSMPQVMARRDQTSGQKRRNCPPMVSEVSAMRRRLFDVAACGPKLAAHCAVVFAISWHHQCNTNPNTVVESPVGQHQGPRKSDVAARFVNRVGKPEVRRRGERSLPGVSFPNRFSPISARGRVPSNRSVQRERRAWASGAFSARRAKKTLRKVQGRSTLPQRIMAAVSRILRSILSSDPKRVCVAGKPNGRQVGCADRTRQAP